MVRVTDANLEAIERETAGGEAYRPEFAVEVRDEAGDVVATVTKTLHIRRETRAQAKASS